MFKLFVRNRRAVAAAMSAMLIASVFTPGGCTITVDEGLVQQLADWASEYEPAWGEPESFGGGLGNDGGCGGFDSPPQQGDGC